MRFSACGSACGSAFIAWSVLLDNGLGIVPIRGDQSWGDLGGSVSETLLKQRADSLISTGLARLGTATSAPMTSGRLPRGTKQTNDLWPILIALHMVSPD